jgi:hypothetical protein
MEGKRRGRERKRRGRGHELGEGGQIFWEVGGWEVGRLGGWEVGRLECKAKRGFPRVVAKSIEGAAEE